MFYGGRAHYVCVVEELIMCVWWKSSLCVCDGRAHYVCVVLELIMCVWWMSS